MEATLKDFDQFPEGLVVKFPQFLPPGLYCDLCRNISPVLFVDPDRHWFCTTCMTMATTEDVFECPCDGKEFSVQKLVSDDTVTARLRNVHVVCPNSRESCPVDVPFSALKAHMDGCSCKEVAPCPDGKKERETTRCSKANEEKERTTPATARDLPVPHGQNPSSGEDRKEKSEASAVPPPIQRQHEFQEATSKVEARTVHLGGSSPDREILQNGTPHNPTRSTNCSFCKQPYERHELKNHMRECSFRRSPSQGNFTSLSPSPEDNGRSASVVNTRPKLERSGYQNGGSPQSPPHMEKRVVKIEADLYALKQQQQELKEELSKNLDKHVRSFQAEKEQMLENVTQLIFQLTEKQGSANCQCAEQVKALKEQNETLSATVTELADDLDLVREEVKALRLMLGAMQR